MSAGAFKCGHPKTPENLSPNGRCRECRNEYFRDYRKLMSPAERYEIKRRYNMAKMLDGARRKVAALENEARRYGMTELLDGDNRQSA